MMLSKIRPFSMCLGIVLSVSVLGASLADSFGQSLGDAVRRLAASAGKDGQDVKRLATFDDFTEWVESVAFSPSGKQLAAGSYEELRLWDAGSREQSAAFKSPGGFVKSMAYSPDGQWLAAGQYQKITLWNVAEQSAAANLAPARTLTGHRGYVTAVAFSADGRRLVSVSDDETIRVWEAESGVLVQTLTGHSLPIYGLAMSPNGSQFATAAGDETRPTKRGEVAVWDVESGKIVHRFEDHKKAATSVAFAADGRHLLSTSVDETVNVYDVESNETLGFFGGHSRPTNCVVLSPDGNRVISGSGGRAKGKHEIKIWDRVSGEVFATIDEHGGKVSALALSPDGNTLVSASHDHSVVFWDVAALVGSTSAQDTTTQVAATVAAVDTKAVQTADVNATSEVAAAAESKSEAETKPEEVPQLRLGIIGLDTSHVIAFTKALNAEDAAADIAGCRVVAAYPKGSPDIKSSVIRVPGYTEQIREMGVEIVDSIEDLVSKVDCVLLETNDGRPHLQQVLPVLRAGKPVFIDKPIAGSLSDAIAIFELSKRLNTPLFSSSSLRYSAGAQALRNGKIGKILGCSTYSPGHLEATHPDLFWYGIHGVETLFTVMGTGCQSVTRTSTEDTDFAVGVWDGGRVGTFRGIRSAKSGYGGMAFGEKGIEPVGSYGGYRPLVVEIVKFFRTKEVPVSAEETLEIYAFMEAADESKRQGGVPVTLESVMKKARMVAEKRLGELGLSE